MNKRLKIRLKGKGDGERKIISRFLLGKEVAIQLTGSVEIWKYAEMEYKNPQGTRGNGHTAKVNRQEKEKTITFLL